MGFPIKSRKKDPRLFWIFVRYGVVGNISACHADARGSIPRFGVVLFYFVHLTTKVAKEMNKLFLLILIIFSLLFFFLLFFFLKVSETPAAPGGTAIPGPR